jgi:hypothetical protein
MHIALNCRVYGFRTHAVSLYLKGVTRGPVTGTTMSKFPMLEGLVSFPFSHLLPSTRLLQHAHTVQGSTHSVKYEAKATRRDISPS